MASLTAISLARRRCCKRIYRIFGWRARSGGDWKSRPGRLSSSGQPSSSLRSTPHSAHQAAADATFFCLPQPHISSSPPKSPNACCLSVPPVRDTCGAPPCPNLPSTTRNTRKHAAAESLPPPNRLNAPPPPIERRIRLGPRRLPPPTLFSSRRALANLQSSMRGPSRERHLPFFP